MAGQVGRLIARLRLSESCVLFEEPEIGPDDGAKPVGMFVGRYRAHGEYCAPVEPRVVTRQERLCAVGAVTVRADQRRAQSGDTRTAPKKLLSKSCPP